jgi:hypothetical protein
MVERALYVLLLVVIVVFVAHWLLGLPLPPR